MDFWIALSVIKTFEEISAALALWFPALPVGQFEQLVHEGSNHEWPPVVIDMETTTSEFPTLVTFVTFPGASMVQINLELARRFAETFSCRAICDGTALGDSDGPYWSLIWDQGTAYLADDYSTDLFDGTDDKVKVLREMKVPALFLNERGQLVGGYGWPYAPPMDEVLSCAKVLLARAGEHSLTDRVILKKLEELLIWKKRAWRCFQQRIITEDELANLVLAHLDTMLKAATGRRFYDEKKSSNDNKVMKRALLGSEPK